MNATILRDFFLGEATAEQVARDIDDAFEVVSSQSSRLRMRDLDEDFEITTSHLVRLLDAVLSGGIPPTALAAVGFGLIASDHFSWDGDTPDGERVANALYDWSAPEVNYGLTLETAAKFRLRLVTGEDTFTRSDFGAPSA